MKVIKISSKQDKKMRKQLGEVLNNFEDCICTDVDRTLDSFFKVLKVHGIKIEVV